MHSQFSRTTLNRAGPLSRMFAGMGCRTFAEACALTTNLPYGRLSEPGNAVLVLTEQRGTCSSKHALLASLAEEIGLATTLMLGIFRMDGRSVPGVGPVLRAQGLLHIPEAHCWLRFQGADFDFTTPDALRTFSRKQILLKAPITPEQTRAFKQAIHYQYIKSWLEEPGAPHRTAADIWRVREACIASLEGGIVSDPPSSHLQMQRKFSL